MKGWRRQFFATNRVPRASASGSKPLPSIAEKQEPHDEAAIVHWDQARGHRPRADAKRLDGDRSRNFHAVSWLFA